MNIVKTITTDLEDIDKTWPRPDLDLTWTTGDFKGVSKEDFEGSLKRVLIVNLEGDMEARRYMHSGRDQVTMILELFYSEQE